MGNGWDFIKEHSLVKAALSGGGETPWERSPPAMPRRRGWAQAVPGAPRLPSPSSPSTSYLLDGKPRRAWGQPRCAPPGPRCRAAEIKPRWIKPGAGVNRGEQQLGGERSARGAPLATQKGWVGSYLGLAPAVPAHLPPGRVLSAGTAAPRRGSAPGGPPGAGWHPSPPVPCLSRKALLGSSAEPHVSDAVSTPSHPLGVRSCQFHLWAVLTTLGLSTAPLLVAPDVTTDTLL